MNSFLSQGTTFLGDFCTLNLDGATPTFVGVTHCSSIKTQTLHFLIMSNAPYTDLEYNLRVCLTIKTVLYTSLSPHPCIL